METEEWFKLKRYPHIGEPITQKDYKWIKRYVQDENCIKKHSFLPLVHKCIVQRKYRSDLSANSRNPSGKRRRIIGTPKIRNIYYSSHLDSLIFSYYNCQLNEKYNELMKSKNFNNSIVAYRKIPLFEGSEKNKCNIDFAKDTFQYIQNNKSKKLSVIVADVTSFFDNLNHKILKKQWTRLLDEKTLPECHFNVFKALTKLRYIESDQLFNSYLGTMIVERGIPNSDKKEYKRIKINSNKFFKEKNAVAYCTKSDFLKNNLNLVISANNSKGIPQGSPISATLANVYMLDFDQEVYDKVESFKGFYQRYSDDLIIVCEQQFEDEIIDFIREKIQNLVKLEISESKTKVYRFEELESKFLGFEIDEKTKEPNFNKTLEYLGFEYNGQKILVKTSGFSKFYRSMKRSFKKSTSLAINSKNPDKNIFKSRLYKRFTYKGANRKLIFRPSKDDPKIYIKTKEYYWGNYLSYLYKANDSMKSINNSDIIKGQSKKIWNRFYKLMMYHESRL